MNRTSKLYICGMCLGPLRGAHRVPRTKGLTRLFFCEVHGPVESVRVLKTSGIAPEPLVEPTPSMKLGTFPKGESK